VQEPGDLHQRAELLGLADLARQVLGTTDGTALASAVRSVRVAAQSARIARQVTEVNLASADTASLQAQISSVVSWDQVKLVEVFRVASGPPPSGELVPVLAVVSPSLPQGASRASAERLASRVAAGATETWVLEPIAAGGELLRGASLVKGPNGRIAGVVVASDYLTGDLAARSRRMTAAYEDYLQLRVLKAPLFGVYVSFFLMVTLLILVGATWMGLYLAKRITRPVQLLAVAAKEIGAGHLDHRVEPETVDEFGALMTHLAAVHPSRYGAMLDTVTRVHLTRVRTLTDQADALRLVVLADRLYDRDIPVLASGVPLDKVFAPEMLRGGYRKKYFRAISRLVALGREGSAALQ